MELVLHHYYRSSSSWRVRWALEEKGLAYRAVAVNLLASEQRSDAYAGVSPTALVPALSLDGQVFTESVAIIELLDDLAPTPPLRPADPRARARMRQLVEIVNAGTQPLQNLSVLTRVSPDRAAQIEWARPVIERGLGAFLRVVEGAPPGPYCLGDELTMADLFLVPQLYNARRFDVPLAGFGRLLEIEAACLARGACARAAPDAWQPG
ncbi:MAG: maleylacetoacetate isomerase [Polyangiaceae bacterium]|nr:maleylacetoacetate isomerase [Polyangiaceae bacterium]